MNRFKTFNIHQRTRSALGGRYSGSVIRSLYTLGERYSVLYTLGEHYSIVVHTRKGILSPCTSIYVAYESYNRHVCAFRNVEHALAVALQSSNALYMRYTCVTHALLPRWQSLVIADRITDYVISVLQSSITLL